MAERKTVLITGASRGLGRALLEHCHSLGWHVFPLVRDAGMAAYLRGEYPFGCTPIVGDVMRDDVGDAITAALHGVGHLDILINNAGIPGKGVRLASATPEELNAAFQTHCLGAMRCTKAALPFMEEGKRVIVNVTSRFGSTTRHAAGTYAHRSISYSYRIAKASQNMFTVCLAQELGEQGFVVCAVHPGRLKTQSGARDADTEPADAAKRLIDWVDTVDPAMNGKCYDLENGEVMAW
jgi:NAD(P)-dependent dehydrogenase (short-subunit alcohol dehydrogenase family)